MSDRKRLWSPRNLAIWCAGWSMFSFGALLESHDRFHYIINGACVTVDLFFLLISLRQIAHNK